MSVGFELMDTTVEAAGLAVAAAAGAIGPAVAFSRCLALIEPLLLLLLILLIPSDDDDVSNDSTGGNNFLGGIIIVIIVALLDDVVDVVVWLLSLLLTILVFCVVGVVNAGIRFRCFHSGLGCLYVSKRAGRGGAGRDGDSNFEVNELPLSL